MEVKKLQDSFKKLLSKDDYKNYEKNLKLASGKSKEVFREEVIKRVKLEYMGCVDSNSNLVSYSYDKNTNKFSLSSQPFDNLIQGNNILQAVTKKYAELASDKYPIITLGGKELAKGENDYIDDLELDTKTGEAVFTSSWNGALLLKGVADIENKNFSFYDIKRINFFEIYNDYNPKLVEGFAVFELIGEGENKNIRLEIYSEGKTEYRLFARGEEENWEELEYDIELEGFAKEGKGYVNTYEDWQVGYIPAVSDYNLDIVSNVAEIVVQDTTTSQAFSKALNPVLQVPDTVLERDKDGNSYINLEDRIVVVGERDKDIKQIEIDVKMEKWNIQRNNLLHNIYISTAVNENILGLSKEGTDMGSGVAVERSMQGILSIVNYKRNKVYKALEEVINWGFKEVYSTDLQLKITGDDILNKSQKEKLEEEGLELDNLEKVASIFVTLQKANSDAEIAEMVNGLGTQLKDKMRSLGLGGLRNGK